MNFDPLPIVLFESDHLKKDIFHIKDYKYSDYVPSGNQILILRWKVTETYQLKLNKNNNKFIQI